MLATGRIIVRRGERVASELKQHLALASNQQWLVHLVSAKVLGCEHDGDVDVTTRSHVAHRRSYVKLRNVVKREGQRNVRVRVSEANRGMKTSAYNALSEADRWRGYEEDGGHTDSVYGNT